MEDKILKYSRINELSQGEYNIIECLSNGHEEDTTAIDEMISYDIRAGVDTENYEINPDFTNRVSDRILYYITSLHINDFTLLECGCGEGLKLVNISNSLNVNIKWAAGIDISWSRIKYAKKNFEKYSVGADYFLCVADMFSLPFSDNSIDVVYTMQGIYAMGGKEKKIISELLRVTSKYLILIEPSYELASEEAKRRMVRNNYVKGLKYTVEELGHKVVCHELFGVDSNPDNPAAVIIVEKNVKSNLIADYNDVMLCDPITRDPLKVVKNVYFSESSYLAYPIIDGIPCLTPENAIVTTKLI